MTHQIAHRFPILNLCAIATLATAALLATAPAAAQSTSPDKVIPNPEPDPGDNFGRCIMATDDGHILAGANDGGSTRTGVLYLIDGITGEVEQTLLNPEPEYIPNIEYSTGFGAFSWMNDTHILTSTFFQNDGETTGSGRAYIFDRFTGELTQTIFNPTPGTNEQFGYGLGMVGDTAIISSRADDTAAHDAGAIYLYNCLDGSLVRSIFNPDPTTQDNFGYSVAGIGEDKILTGVPASDVGVKDSGIAYLLLANTGAVIHKIVNPDPAENAAFGFQVRAHGDDLLIGAPGINKAYLFDSETGSLIHRFETLELEIGEAYGACVGSTGDYIVIGAPLVAVGENDMTGRAYIYSAATGNLLETLENPTPEAEDRFGVSVAGMNGKIVISADLDTVGSTIYSGSLYIYQPPPAAAGPLWKLFR